MLDLSSPKVMGVLNLTPDSFYDGGKHNTIDKALKQCAQMLEEGAAVVDLGAYSSRPGSEPVSEEEETKRMFPVLRAVMKEFPEALISIDTFRASVADLAIQEGGAIINDISAGELDTNMFATVARLKVPYVLMHMKGTPQTMNQHTNYENLFTEVSRYFVDKINQLRSLGVVDVVIDPGFGFSKTIDQNYELLNKLDLFKMLGVPVLAGLSRKSMIFKLLDVRPADSLNGTTVVNTMALLKGANFLRVHDVKAAVQAVEICNKLNNCNG